MILWQNKYSPFARKVLVLAHELGVREQISLQDTDPHSDESLRSANPLCKIPTLILDDGRALYDSRVICEYLLTLGDASRVAGPPWVRTRPPDTASRLSRIASASSRRRTARSPSRPRWACAAGRRRPCARSANR